MVSSKASLGYIAKLCHIKKKKNLENSFLDSVCETLKLIGNTVPVSTVEGTDADLESKPPCAPSSINSICPQFWECYPFTVYIFHAWYMNEYATYANAQKNTDFKFS
jgi:hypothetical protein